MNNHYIFERILNTDLNVGIFKSRKILDVCFVGSDQVIRRNPVRSKIFFECLYLSIRSARTQTKTSGIEMRWRADFQPRNYGYIKHPKIHF